MNWEKKYLVSRSVLIQVSDDGRLVATNSVSRDPQEITTHALHFVLLFLAPTSCREAFDRMNETWEVEESVFSEMIGRLLLMNLLVPEDATPEDALASKGFASVPGQHVMLRDAIRVLQYRDAIRRQVPGKNVIEIGCGTGILSIFAAQAGAKKVTAIEETEILFLAREMVKANGYENTISIVAGNSKNVTPDEPADIIIHEIIGNDPFAENMLFYIADARKRLIKEGGVFLPGRFTVCCAGFEAGDRQRILQEAKSFETLYGLNFDPYLEALAETSETAFIPIQSLTTMKPRILSAECQLFAFDFNAGFDPQPPDVILEMEITASGLLGGAYLYFTAWLDEQTPLGNSPFMPETHWGWQLVKFNEPVRVNAGEKVKVKASLVTDTGKQRLRLDHIKE